MLFAFIFIQGIIIVLQLNKREIVTVVFIYPFGNYINAGNNTREPRSELNLFLLVKQIKLLLYKPIPALFSKATVLLVVACFLSAAGFTQEENFDSVPVFRVAPAACVTAPSRISLPLQKPDDFRKSFLSFIQPGADTLKNPFRYKPKLPVINAKAGRDVIKNLESELKKNLTTPVVFNKATAGVSGQAGNFNSDSAQHYNYNLFDAELSGSILGIPFNSLYQNHYHPFITSSNLNRISFRYDREEYLENLKRKLKDKFNPEDYLTAIKDPVEMMKTMAEKALRNEFDNLKSQFAGLLDDKINQVGNLQDLFLKDIGRLRQQLLSPEWLKKLNDAQQLAAQLQNRINTGEPTDEQQFTQVKNEIRKYRGVQELVTVLETHSKKWQQSGLIQKIKESGLLKKEMIRKIINDPGMIRKIAKQKLDLNSLQRLFLSITKLNAGQSTADFSRMLTGNTLLNGLNAGFLLNNNRSLGVMAGTQRTFNSVMDLPFTNNIFNSNNTMTGLRLMSGPGNNSIISLLAFQTNNYNLFPLAGFALPRRSVVAGISRQFAINKTSWIETELSKSSGYFLNELNGDSANINRKFSDLFGSGDFLKSLAASVNYSGYFEEIDLSNETFIKYSGIRYDNPATAFVPAGTIEAGTGVRKSFYKKKLQLHARTQWREYKFSETSGRRWRNTHHFIDVKWRMKRGQSLSLRYQPAKSVTVSAGEKKLNFVTERLAAAATIAAKARSFQYRNYLTLAWQRNKYGSQSALFSGNQSLQITSLQNFIIGSQSFYTNIAYNRTNSPSAFIFFNTSFSADAGVSYMIGKNLSASSSLNYNSVKGWYRQVAYRQSLAGQVGKKINMDLYLDIGKNVKLLQPLPYSLFRAEWSVQYMFNQ